MRPVSRDHVIEKEALSPNTLASGAKGRYSPEYVWESYYAARLFPGFMASFDVQRDANPAYNHDRGPVMIYSLRLHVELGLKPWRPK
jgi:hypothetical protein